MKDRCRMAERRRRIAVGEVVECRHHGHEDRLMERRGIHPVGRVPRVVLDPGRDARVLEMAGFAWHPGAVIDYGAGFTRVDLGKRESGIPTRWPWAIGRGDPREWDDVGDGEAFGRWPEDLEGRQWKRSPRNIATANGCGFSIHGCRRDDIAGSGWGSADVSHKKKEGWRKSEVLQQEISVHTLCHLPR